MARTVVARECTPRTNGKTERFIQTAIREWARACQNEPSLQRALHFNPWLHQYNWHRPHASLNKNPPISRSSLDRNNLLMHNNYSLLLFPALSICIKPFFPA